MKNYLKRYERRAFLALSLFSISIGLLSLYTLFTGSSNAVKLLGTAGLLTTVTGVVQLDVSGLFERIIEYY
jgi:hypothetical protein